MKLRKKKARCHDNLDFLVLSRSSKNVEPKPDIAKCSACGWSGKASLCAVEKEGSWEEGYYDIQLCPKCEDGGCIDDYDFSFWQWLKLEWWEFRQND